MTDIIIALIGGVIASVVVQRLYRPRVYKFRRHTPLFRTEAELDALRRQSRGEAQP